MEVRRSRHEARAKGALRSSTLGGMPIEHCVEGRMRTKCSTRLKDEPKGRVDRAVAELAGRQHGVVARWQLVRLGMSATAVKRRLARGSLHQVHRGVYAVGHRVLSQDSRWLMAVLAFGPDTVLSHRSAGQLWRIVPRYAIAPEVARSASVRGKRGIVVHRSTIPMDERTIEDGIPVTTAPRTMLDLSSLLDLRQLERAWNEMEVRGLTDSLSVPDLLARHPGRRGVAKLRVLLDGDESEGITRNEFEEAFVALLDRHGLPRGRMNADLAVRGRFFVVDCLWERQRLAVELDGGGVHRTRRAFQDDRLRDRILVAEGWRTSRITWDQLRDEPTEIAADLGRALAEAPFRSVPPGHHPHPAGE
jgi:very-short-patch-repair endonuclease